MPETETGVRAISRTWMWTQLWQLRVLTLTLTRISQREFGCFVFFFALWRQRRRVNMSQKTPRPMIDRLNLVQHPQLQERCTQELSPAIKTHKLPFKNTLVALQQSSLGSLDSTHHVHQDIS